MPARATTSRVLSASAVAARLRRARADPLLRSSALLIADNLLLGAVGGLCTILAARFWPPRAVAVVAAVGGGFAMLITACNMGMPATIVRYLAREPDQRAMMKQALITTGTVAVMSALVVSSVPGHFGVPLRDVGLCRGGSWPFSRRCTSFRASSWL